MASHSSEEELSSLKVSTDIIEKNGVTYVKLTHITYTWTIHNYSFLQKKTGDSFESPIFSAEEHNKPKWQLLTYPNGNTAETDGYLSLFLLYVSSEQSDVEAAFRLCLLNSKKQKINERKIILHKFYEKGSSWGFPNFMKTSFLKDAENYLLPNDTLTILCDLSIYAGNIEIGDSEEIKVPESSIFDQQTDLFETMKFSDVTLVTLNREFQAHKVILAMRSPVFSAMFEHDMLEQKENRVDITDIDDAVLMELLRFIYTEKTINLDNMAEDLLVAANKYQLKRLTALCEKSLSKGLTVENAPRLLILSDLYNCIQLKARALSLICARIEDIFETASYKSMCDTHPYLINEVLRAFAAPKALSGSTVVPRK